MNRRGFLAAAGLFAPVAVAALPQQRNPNARPKPPKPTTTTAATTTTVPATTTTGPAPSGAYFDGYGVL